LSASNAFSTNKNANNVAFVDRNAQEDAVDNVTISTGIGEEVDFNETTFLRCTDDDLPSNDRGRDANVKNAAANANSAEQKLYRKKATAQLSTMVASSSSGAASRKGKNGVTATLFDKLGIRRSRMGDSSAADTLGEDIADSQSIDKEIFYVKTVTSRKTAENTASSDQRANEALQVSSNPKLGGLVVVESEPSVARAMSYHKSTQDRWLDEIATLRKRSIIT
jgi:hypothetical protein